MDPSCGFCTSSDCRGNDGYTSPKCPEHGKKAAKRFTKRQEAAGHTAECPMEACESFPQCRGVRERAARNVMRNALEQIAKDWKMGHNRKTVCDPYTVASQAMKQADIILSHPTDRE